MKRFVARFGDAVTGVLSGFDRLVFRGSIQALVRERGMYTFLCRAGVRLLDFKEFVSKTSERLKAASLAEAIEQGRPVRYLDSARADKEALARQLLAESPTDAGLICAFTVLEPCSSFEYHRATDRSLRGLKLRPRKCLHIYKYWLHPIFGFMSARIQTWFPFGVQICLNGREWLAHQLLREGRGDFDRHDNCFTRVANPALAQRRLDRQLTLDWPAALHAVARELNPLHAEIFEPWPQEYYWSVYQSEWATDLLFRDTPSLASCYPSFVRHALLHFQSPDVMRFLGRKAHGNFTGDLVTSFKNRIEGVRVKHWVRGNSLKMYDKAGSVLRVETTIAQTTDFKVFRRLQNRPKSPMDWRPLRKGVADLHRRAEVSQRANETYLDALAAISHPTPVAELFDRVARPTTYRARRVRALRIGDPADLELLRAACRGEFATSGFRNRDLRNILYPTTSTSKQEARRLSARVGRQIRLLRAHGLAQKIQKTHRYQLTERGQQLAAALFAARQATVSQLLALAA
jgi:hypothetical protein